MKLCEVPLQNMPDIVVTCVVLHNLYIMNKENIEDNWIMETENKLSGRISEGEI